MNKQPIYAITCLQNLKESKLGWPEFGGVSFMGFYHEKETAFERVLENACDIAECLYRYACIEEISPGLYQFPRNRWFFKYDHEKGVFEQIEEPEFMKKFTNIL